MKKLLVLFLLLFSGMLFSIAPIRFAMKMVAKACMYQQIEQRKIDLPTQCFSATLLVNATWENKHEFKLDGAYYDVLFTTEVNGITNYHCLNDALEARIDNKADDYILSCLYHIPGKSANETRSSLLDFLQHLYFSPPGIKSFDRPDFYSCNVFKEKPISYAFTFITSPVIPPEMVA